MYYVDSVPGLVRAFDYDVTRGTCGRPRELWSGDGIPDGLCVDVDGNLWIAFFGEGEVRCLSPDGGLLGIVDVPVPNPTCAAFVGPDLDRLLITTARRKLDAEGLRRWPESGGLFIADVGVRGLPAGAWAGSTSAIR
jgi:sugar lactone lactonase YvrE